MQQGSHSNLRRNQKLYRTRSENSAHHILALQNLQKQKLKGRRQKRKRRKQDYKNKLKAIKKMAIEHIYQ